MSYVNVVSVAVRGEELHLICALGKLEDTFSQQVLWAIYLFCPSVPVLFTSVAGFQPLQAPGFPKRSSKRPLENS